MNKKERLLKLINLLSEEHYDRRRIEKELDKSEGFIDRALSTGVISEKALEAIERLHEKITSTNYDIGIAIRKIEASNEVILSAVGEVLAKINNQSSTIVREQLEELVKKRLNERES